MEGFYDTAPNDAVDFKSRLIALMPAPVAKQTNVCRRPSIKTKLADAELRDDVATAFAPAFRATTPDPASPASGTSKIRDELCRAMVARSDVPSALGVLDKATEADRTNARTFSGRVFCWAGRRRRGIIPDVGRRSASKLASRETLLKASGLLGVFELLMLVGDKVCHKKDLRRPTKGLYVTVLKRSEQRLNSERLYQCQGPLPESQGVPEPFAQKPCHPPLAADFDSPLRNAARVSIRSLPSIFCPPPS